MSPSTVKTAVRSALCLVAVCLALTACRERLAYHHTAVVDLRGWTARQPCRYAVPDTAHVGGSRAFLDLRLTESYPYRWLDLEVEQRTGSTRRAHTDTLRLHVYDSDGNMKGTGVHLIGYSLPLRLLPSGKGDTLTVLVRHAMQADTLPGIADIALRIERP